MKLNANTLQILKNFSIICPSIIIEKGNVLSTYSFSRAVRGTAVLDQEFPERFALNNVNRFLGILSTINEPTIDFRETHMVISDGKANTVKYNYTNEKNIYNKDWYEAYFNVPEVKDPVVSFKLNDKDFTNLKRGSSTLGLMEVAVVGDGNVVNVVGLNSKEKHGNMYTLNTFVATDKTFSAFLKIENLNMLSLDYDVDLMQRFVRFKHEGLEYRVAVEKHSTFK